MHTYFKILSTARNIFIYIPLYCFYTLIAIVFSLINISMLIPILELIFNEVNYDTITRPSFSFSILYLKDIFKYYFNSIIEIHGNVMALYFVSITLVISVFCNDLFRYLASNVMSKIKVKVVTNLRENLFKCAFNNHISLNKGDVMSRLSSDIQEIEHAIEDIFRVCFKEPATILGFFCVMHTMSPYFTVIAYSMLSISGALIVYVINRLKQDANSTQTTMATIIGSIQDILNDIDVFRILDTHGYIAKKLKYENDDYMKFSLLMECKKNLIPSLSEFLGITIMAIVLVYGGNQILLHKTILPTSIFITYIALFSQAIVPIKAMTKSLSNIQRSSVAGRRVFDILDCQIACNTQSLNIQTFESQIELREVSFAYLGTNVLHEVNMTIKKGSKVLIIGESGAGKSTIINIICGLITNYSGNVIVDGHELHEYNKKNWYSLLGYCNRESLILNDTVLNNIALGNDIDSVEVDRIVNLVGASDFIEELPNKYDTVVNNRSLSSGQCQRLCLARTLAKHPKIIIMDEATSSVDASTEKLIYNNLMNVYKDETIIIVTHHILNKDYFDIVYNIECGRCEQSYV